MADATMCQATALARGIKDCKTREQIALIAALAERTKGGMTPEQKLLVVDAVVTRTHELVCELQAHSTHFISRF